MTTPAKPKTVPAPDWREVFARACQDLPEQVVIPYELTPEGQRLKEFKRVCPDKFFVKIDRTRLPCPEQFDLVAKWDGTFPGPMAWGAADTAKTLAAWSAMGRLYVKENRPFAWFPAKRLITEMHEADEGGDLNNFFRRYSHFRVLMVDDVEKVNLEFGSTIELLFAFYDWVYRSRISCITTSNQGPGFWDKMMGGGMTRRLFKDGHFAVEFRKPAAERAAKTK